MFFANSDQKITVWSISPFQGFFVSFHFSFIKKHIVWSTFYFSYIYGKFSPWGNVIWPISILYFQGSYVIFFQGFCMNFHLKLIYLFVVKRFIKKIISGEILFRADNLTKYNKNANPTMAVRCQQGLLFLSQTYLFLNRAFPSLTVRPVHFFGSVLPTFRSQSFSFFDSDFLIFTGQSFPLCEVRPSHFFGSVLPTFPSQSFSFFEPDLPIFWVSPSNFIY